MTAPTAPTSSAPSAPVAAPPEPDSSAGSARLVALVVAVVMIGLLGLLVWGIGRRAAGTVGTVPIAARPAPTFTLALFDGGTLSLADTRGTPVLINFWASWCIPCEEEAAALERASRAYRDRVVFLGVNVQDTDPLAREFLRRFGVTYPNGRDATGEIAVEYGMSGVPETYFVDRNGQIVRKWQGALDDARIAAFLDELLR